MQYTYNKTLKKSKNMLRHMSAVIAVLAVVALAFGVNGASQAKGGGGAALPGDNKQIVTGTTAPCATTTVDPGAVVKSIATTDPVTGEPVTGFTTLSMRGTLSNCSTSLQSYYITFNEPARNVFDTIGQPTCTLTFGYGDWSVGAYIMKSGERKGWSFTNEIVGGAGVADPTNCYGTHNLVVNVIDMSTGVLLQTLNTTYTVTQ